MFVQRAFAAFVLLGIIYPVFATLVRNKASWEKPLMHVGWASFVIGIAIGVVMIGGEAAKVWNTVAANAALGTKWMTMIAWIASSANLQTPIPIWLGFSQVREVIGIEFVVSANTITELLSFNSTPE